MDKHLAVPEQPSYQEVIAAKQDAVWKRLAQISVGSAATSWLASLPSPLTRKNYLSGWRMLERARLVNSTESLQVFALRNHEVVLDSIKGMTGWSEATRQARAALYVAFTRFLSRRSEGQVRKAIPSREGTSRTFFKVRDTVATRAMSRAQWGRFLAVLERLNSRDALVAKLILQGGKRKSEVLTLTTAQIDWESRQITYVQAKAKGTAHETVITHPPHLMAELSRYVGSRTGHVFITGTGNPVHPSQIDRTFARAGEEAGVPFKVTPHVLRASTVTYFKREGFSDTDIMRVTGHASADMVRMYDKTSRAENASSKVSLV